MTCKTSFIIYLFLCNSVLRVLLPKSPSVMFQSYRNILQMRCELHGFSLTIIIPWQTQLGQCNSNFANILTLKAYVFPWLRREDLSLYCDLLFIFSFSSIIRFHGVNSVSKLTINIPKRNGIGYCSCIWSTFQKTYEHQLHISFLSYHLEASSPIQ